MVEGISAHFFPLDEDVVAPRGVSRKSEFLQQRDHHINIAVKSQRNALSRVDVAEHDVVLIGIHAAAPTLPAVGLDAVGLAVRQIDLIFDELVAPEDDSRPHLPHEKALLDCGVASKELFGGEIEGESADGGIGKVDVAHGGWDVFLQMGVNRRMVLTVSKSHVGFWPALSVGLTETLAGVRCTSVRWMFFLQAKIAILF